MSEHCFLRLTDKLTDNGDLAIPGANRSEERVRGLDGIRGNLHDPPVRIP